MRSRHRLGLLPVFLALVGLVVQPETHGQEKAQPRKAPFAVTMSGEIDAQLAPVAGKLTEVFFQSYPKLVERFENPNKPAARTVQVVFEKNMKVPAHASGSKVTISVEWMKKNPGDLGILTHELTHVVQAYPTGDPGWLTEGIADYARQVHGPKENGWALPERLTRKNSYKDSYRVTAKFLVWLDEKHAGSVDKLHRQMQNREFQIGDFKTITGKTVDTLWEECVKEMEKK